MILTTIFWRITRPPKPNANDSLNSKFRESQLVKVLHYAQAVEFQAHLILICQQLSDIRAIQLNVKQLCHGYCALFTIAD